MFSEASVSHLFGGGVWYHFLSGIMFLWRGLVSLPVWYHAPSRGSPPRGESASRRGGGGLLPEGGLLVVAFCDKWPSVISGLLAYFRNRRPLMPEGHYQKDTPSPVLTSSGSHWSGQYTSYWNAFLLWNLSLSEKSTVCSILYLFALWILG